MNIDDETLGNTGSVQERTFTINPQNAHADAFTLANLLFRYSECVMQVNSKDRKLTKETLIDSESTQDYWIRHEVDTGQVYVKSKQFKRKVGKALQQDLKSSTQYLGYTNKHFYAGTPYPSQLCACHVFNTKQAPAKRVAAIHGTIPEEKITSHRNYLMRMHGNDRKLVDVLMKEWVDSYHRPKKIVKNKAPKPENIAEQKRTAKRLKVRIDEMEAWKNDLCEWAKEVKRQTEEDAAKGGVREIIWVEEAIKALSMRILATPTTPQEKKQARTRLQAISEYVKLHKRQIRTTITRLTKVPETPHTEGAAIDPDYTQKLIPALATLPEYDPRNEGLETIGRYIETVRLDGSGRKKTLYLHTVPLRDYLEKHYPNLRIKLKDDIRYTHSQNFKLHSLPDASGLYCAVFDWRRTGENGEKHKAKQ